MHDIDFSTHHISIFVLFIYIQAEIMCGPKVIIHKSFLELFCQLSLSGRWYIRGVVISSSLFCERPVHSGGLTASSARAPGQICQLPAGQTMRMLKYVSILGCKQAVYSWTWSISIRNSQSSLDRAESLL